MAYRAGFRVSATGPLLVKGTLMSADQRQGPSPLTAITPIIPGKEAAVQAMLDVLQKRINEGTPIELDDVGTVHFARWVILRDGDEAQLLVTTDFDGPWEEYVDDFIDHAWKVLDALYSNCEGYPAYGARDSVAFKAYMRKYQLKEDVYYRACPDASVAEIQRALRITRGIKQVLEGLQELS
jgi:hypothetical protein